MFKVLITDTLIASVMDLIIATLLPIAQFPCGIDDDGDERRGRREYRTPVQSPTRWPAHQPRPTPNGFKSSGTTYPMSEFHRVARITDTPIPLPGIGDLWVSEHNIVIVFTSLDTFCAVDDHVLQCQLLALIHNTVVDAYYGTTGAAAPVETHHERQPRIRHMSTQLLIQHRCVNAAYPLHLTV